MTKLISLVVCAVLVANDQLLKILAIRALERPIVIIPGLFYLTYVENRGAAFGILQGQTLLLSFFSIIVMAVLLAAIFSGKIREKILVWSLVLILAGGAGNCIDRMVRGFVVDYFDFSAVLGFPVFNFADCCVVIGTCLIFIHIFFLERKKTHEVKGEGVSEVEWRENI